MIGDGSAILQGRSDRDCKGGHAQIDDGSGDGDGVGIRVNAGAGGQLLLLVRLYRHRPRSWRRCRRRQRSRTRRRQLRSNMLEPPLNCASLVAMPILLRTGRVLTVGFVGRQLGPTMALPAICFLPPQTSRMLSHQRHSRCTPHHSSRKHVLASRRRFGSAGGCSLAALNDSHKIGSARW